MGGEEKMSRKKLNLNPEERRLYNNKLHRKQNKIRRERAEREACKKMVQLIVGAFEDIGWDEIELVIGAEDEIIDNVVDKIMQEDKIKFVLGSKMGVKIK